MDYQDGRKMGISRIMVLGIAVILLVPGAFGAWAVLVPLDSATIAFGELSIVGMRKTVQHLEGGLIKEILVEEGDEVTAGEILFKMDDTNARSLVTRLEAQLNSASALQVRLKAEYEGLQEIDWTEWLDEESGILDGQDLIAAQERIFAARLRSLDNQTAIYEEQIAQLREEITGIEDEMESQKTQAGFLESELIGLRSLVEKGLAGKQRLLLMERTLAVVQGDRAKNKSIAARAERRISEIELLVLEIGNRHTNEVAAELREVETRIFDLLEQIATARAAFERTRIAAPVSGTVVGLRVSTLGGVIGPGTPLLDIVPAGSELIVVARIDPQDVDSVHPNSSVRVRLTAFSDLNAPLFTGTVTGISADRFNDERTNDAWYEVRVTLDPDDPELDASKLQPGMTAEVMIKTGERTTMEYLLKPILSSFNRALREE